MLRFMSRCVLYKTNFVIQISLILMCSQKLFLLWMFVKIQNQKCCMEQQNVYAKNDLFDSKRIFHYKFSK